MIDPDWVERQLQRIVTRGWPVLVIAVIGLGVLGIVGYHFTARLEDIRIAQSDNTTWLIAQSEVEALKLAEKVIVARQGPMGRRRSLICGRPSICFTAASTSSTPM
ncbi:hypothetical protein ACFSHQ_04235 [Gemmobacter lanyuensis]